jgi:tetratricopeptide (TPR) repeat protein
MMQKVSKKARNAAEVRAQAEKHVQEGRPKEALEVLDAALEEIGAEAGLLREKARLHFVHGDSAAGRKAIDRLISIEPRNAENWYAKSWSLLAENNVEEALECAERAIALDEQSVPGHVLRGDCLLALRRWTEAFAAFGRAAALDLQQFDASSWASRGDRFLEGGQPDLALQAYEHAIAQDARNPQGWHGKGFVLYQRGDFEGSLAAFERASEVDHRFIAGFLNAGALCVNRRAFDRALCYFERARELRPDDLRPWISIGDVLEQLDRYNEARAAYEHAATIEPKNALDWSGIGDCFVHLDRFDDALRSYERAIELEPDDGWLHYKLSRLHCTQHRWDEATQAIDRAIELNPDNGDFWVGKLDILNQKDVIEPAAIDANVNRALEAIGSDVSLRLCVAHFLADNDRFDRAREVVVDVEQSMLRDEADRLSLAECLLKVSENVAAMNLLHSIDPSRLRRSMPIIRSFLQLLADRLTRAPRLSEELLVNFLRELRLRIDHIHTTHRDWNFKGVRRLLMRSKLQLLDEFVLATLIDLQEAKVHYKDLSFFTETWSESEAQTVRPSAG